MTHDNNDRKIAGPSQVPGRQSGKSQDAIRHQKDALHHKIHKASEAGKSAGLLDSDSAQQIEELPEVPKVGSRDAPGG